jgi:uncharacterized membrane protein
LLVGICVTPLTAVAGWLFWMGDDQGVTAMTIHKWLGTSLAVLLFGLLLWRWRLARQKRWASVPYLCAGIVVIAALIYQGHLGGDQTYGDMASAAPTALQATLHTTARYPRRDREGAWLLCPLRRNAS